MLIPSDCLSTASSEPNVVWPVDVINTKTGRRCQQFSNDVTFYLIDYRLIYLVCASCTPCKEYRTVFQAIFVISFGKRTTIVLRSFTIVVRS